MIRVRGKGAETTMYQPILEYCSPGKIKRIISLAKWKTHEFRNYVRQKSIARILKQSPAVEAKDDQLLKENSCIRSWPDLGYKY